MAPPTYLAASGAPWVSPSSPALNVEKDNSFQRRQLQFFPIHHQSEVLVQLRFLGNHALQAELYISTFVLESVNGKGSVPNTNLHLCSYVCMYICMQCVTYVRTYVHMYVHSMQVHIHFIHRQLYQLEIRRWSVDNKSGPWPRPSPGVKLFRVLLTSNMEVVGYLCVDADPKVVVHWDHLLRCLQAPTRPIGVNVKRGYLS